MRDDLIHLPEAPTASAASFDLAPHEAEPSIDEFWSLQETDPSESSLILLEVLRDLDRPAQLVLELHYVKGLTLTQTAYVMELARHEVEALRLSVLKTLRRAFSARMQQEYT